MHLTLIANHINECGQYAKEIKDHNHSQLRYYVVSMERHCLFSISLSVVGKNQSYLVRRQ